MRLESAAARQMRNASEGAGGHEACGLLFGNADAILEATVAPNVSAEPWHRFEIDPAHLFEAHRKGRAGPARLIGCWHSHPNGRGEPSRHDRAGAADMGWLWLSVAAGSDGGGDIFGWRPTADGFEPVALIDGSL